MNSLTWFRYLQHQCRDCRVDNNLSEVILYFLNFSPSLKALKGYFSSSSLLFLIQIEAYGIMLVRSIFSFQLGLLFLIFLLNVTLCICHNLILPQAHLHYVFIFHFIFQLCIKRRFIRGINIFLFFYL